MSHEGFYLDLKLNHFLIFVSRDDPAKRIQVYTDDPRTDTILWNDFEYSCEQASVPAKPFQRYFGGAPNP